MLRLTLRNHQSFYRSLQVKSSLSKSLTVVKAEGLPFLTWYGIWYTLGVTLCHTSVSCRPELYNKALTVMKAVNLDRLVDVDRIDPAIGKWTLIFVMNNILEIPRLPFVLASYAWWKRAVVTRL